MTSLDPSMFALIVAVCIGVVGLGVIKIADVRHKRKYGSD
jgi:hypothetical protein